MTENMRTYGLGFAMVDAKVLAKNNSITELPREPQALVSYLDSQPEVELKAGGSTTNTLAAYIGILTNNSVRLFAAVGSDKRGDFLRNVADPKLGNLQIVENDPTGTIIYLLSADGNYIDIQSFYGAATRVTVPVNSLRDEKKFLFISNCFALSNPNVSQEVNKAVEVLVKNGGFFALNLSGANLAEISEVELRSSIDALPLVPSVAVGNESEAKRLTGKNDVMEAAMSLFPNSRLVVITRDKNGSLVRFENRIISIPAYPCKIVNDPTGAGDCYMGAMLACLFEKPYISWTLNDIKIAATTASYAAAKVVERFDSRLPKDEYKDIRLFFENLKQIF